MGICFIYLNLDREEYFGIGALGGGMKSGSLGRNLEARALGLLLMEQSPVANDKIEQGAWAGNRVMAVGDGDAPANVPGALIDERRTLYEYAREHCRDIASA
ncbi:MAG: hypothetical protein ACR2PA_10235, partial [Hyphomicrobiaceae bacterium]